MFCEVHKKYIRTRNGVKIVSVFLEKYKKEWN